MTILTITPEQIADGLLEPGSYWSGDVVTYSIPDGGTSWASFYGDAEPTDPAYSEFTQAQRDRFIAAIELWDSYIAIDLNQVDDGTTSGDIRIAFTDIDSRVGEGYFGYAYYAPFDDGTPFAESGDVWIDDTFKTSTFAQGSSDFEGLLHEIGHTLGMKHPFESPQLPLEYQSYAFTLMGYEPTDEIVLFAASAGGGLGYSVTATRSVTPTLLDVAAIQALYGADTATASGNDIYQFTDFGMRDRRTIYDAGGNDTIDLSSLSRGSVLDLRPGAYSDVAYYSKAQQIADTKAQYPGFDAFIESVYNGTFYPLYEWTFNLGIAYTTIIENAIGSSKADTIIGNSASNNLAGGLGADILDSAGGDDTLDGGGGDDIAVFRGVRGDYVVTLLQDGRLQVVDRVAGRDGTDLLTSVERGQFSDGTVTLEPNPPGGNQAPVAGSDVLYISRGSAAHFPTGFFLTNDSDGNGDPLSITAVSAAVNASVALGSGLVDVTATALTAPSTGSFNYTLSDGSLTATGAVTFNLVTTSSKGETFTVTTLANQASWIDGNGGNDRITGGAGFDHLSGNDGTDALFGMAGFDVLFGGTGNDTLDGGAGNDFMFGGAGNDIYVVDDLLDVVDESVASGPTPGDDAGGTADLVNSSVTFTIGAYLENLTLTGSGIIDGTGNDLANKINGNGAVNTLTGNGGADILSGLGGNDFLFGGAGIDTLTGGGGVDTMDGGEDGDTYNVDQSDTVFDSGTLGVDKVITGTNFSLATGDGIENLKTLYAGPGVATLKGNDLKNTIEGGGVRDKLFGLANDDTIKGNGGDDELTGGLGKDNLTGGDGLDKFIYALGDTAVTAAGFDIITDFVSGVDRIDLSIFTGTPAASAYAEVTNGTNAFGSLKTSADAALNGTVKAVFVSGQTNGWLFWDTNADGFADEAIQLLGLNNVNAFQAADLT